MHADSYARQANQDNNLSIQLVWDEDTARGRDWADELGVPFESELESVLQNPNIDAVIVCTPTNLHKEVIMKAAKHQKHIFTEKVLAFTVEDCQEIYDVVEAFNVHLMVSLPHVIKANYLYAQQIVDQELLGEITMLRCRKAHNGAVPQEDQSTGWLPEHFFDQETCGGGSFIDLGAHPIYLTNRLAGPAKSICARLQTQSDKYEVDDNAVAIIEYTSGAIGVVEASFMSHGSPFQLELYGTAGTLLIENNHIRLKTKQTGDDWIEPEEQINTLPTPLEQWVNAITHNQQSSITKEDIVNLSRINQAATLSNQQEKKVYIEEIIGGKSHV
ncbi:oxidoreductase domain-containing protein [Gracilibacillus halophilus YIM-C55.5]|uniref:Oxidoreductase domain-containing protein n=1 Tax=Gracilibacillus halophilus YIM-C55.5 TaxID=1308866 RepID=N4WUS1_9BACI|nr:Gfo/Idh/MocA family oxidoreductase [Gracilibacillus halophilus]ENH96866.1 oxidoreductase domain-containing protein [Gracilibacillus halophilus YIM-C55.5]